MLLPFPGRCPLARLYKISQCAQNGEASRRNRTPRRGERESAKRHAVRRGRRGTRAFGRGARRPAATVTLPASRADAGSPLCLRAPATQFCSFGKWAQCPFLRPACWRRALLARYRIASTPVRLPLRRDSGIVHLRNGQSAHFGGGWRGSRLRAGVPVSSTTSRQAVRLRGGRAARMFRPPPQRNGHCAHFTEGCTARRARLRCRFRLSAATGAETGRNEERNGHVARFLESTKGALNADRLDLPRLQSREGPCRAAGQLGRHPGHAVGQRRGAQHAHDGNHSQ